MGGGWRAAAMLALAGLAGCSSAGMSSRSEVPMVAQASTRAEGRNHDASAGGTSRPAPGAVEAELLPVNPPFVEVWLDTRDRPLGAYTLTLRYDPSIVRVQDVGTGDLSKFPDLPRANPDSYASGETRIAGFQTAGLSPTGKTRVATVFFASAGPGASPLSATLETLVDPDGGTIAGQVVLSTDRLRSR